MHCACRLHNTNCICVICSKYYLNYMINGDYIYTFLITYPGVFPAKCIICHCLYCWWCPVHVLNEYSVSNLRYFIYQGMVDRTSLIWSYRNLCSFIVHGMVNSTNLMWSYHNLCSNVQYILTYQNITIWYSMLVYVLIVLFIQFCIV